MSDVPDKAYFSRVSRSTGFKTDSLEKVYRIMAILERIRGIPELYESLALKGGTAIQGILFGFRRLSVDIDLNYVGHVERDLMRTDREEIRRTLVLLFRDMGYRIEKPVSMYAEEQFDIRFTNCGGGADRLKLEVNYLERLPVLGTVQARIISPFDGMGRVEVRSYPPEELFAGKVRALIARGSPRDIYDADLISSGSHPYDHDLLRKVTLFYLSMSNIDVRKATLGSIDEVSEKDVKDILYPMLPRGDRPDLSRMKENISERIGPILDLEPDEREYFDSFYGERVADVLKLFGDRPVNDGLSRHPAILWRIMEMDRKGGIGTYTDTIE